MLRRIVKKKNLRNYIKRIRKNRHYVTDLSHRIDNWGRPRPLP